MGLKVLVRVAVTCAAASLAIVQAAQRPTEVGRSLEVIEGREAAPGEVLVRFRSRAVAAMRQVEQDVSADENTPVGKGDWRRLRSSRRSAQTLLTALRSRRDVVSVEPNFVLRTQRLPNDPEFPQMWGLRNLVHPGADIHATGAWNVSIGSRAVVVGVIDTGIDYTHPDLQANVWAAPTAFAVTIRNRTITCPAGSHGFNSVALTCDPLDDHGHGTHVAGTIGAAGNNSEGVAGVNWTSSVMGLKFLDATGAGFTSGAIEAIDFAIQAKAFFGAGANVRVLSNSYGGDGFSQAMSDEIDRAAAADMLFVAAAGNAAADIDVAPTYPASSTNANVITVAATGDSDGLASFSNYGAESVDLGAPGVNVRSTTPNNTYSTFSGTSMATPHVSGAAALILSACALNTTDLKHAILSTVDPVLSLTGITVTNGRLNIDRAIHSCAADNMPPMVTLTSPRAGDTPPAAPATIALEATASDSDGLVTRVEYFVASNPTPIGSSTSGPRYTATWSGVAAGTYSVTARATDNGDVTTTSAPVIVTVNAAGGGGPSAVFVRADPTTQGTWLGTYGHDGYTLANGAASLPAYAMVTLTGQAAWTWAASTADVRALQRPAATDRFAATWYNGSAFSIDINLTDGLTHQVAVYAVDWDTTTRAQRIDVVDAISGTVLDSRVLAAFNAGRYLVWNLRGHVTLRATHTAGSNAALSALLFDSSGSPNVAPTVALTSPRAEDPPSTAPATIALEATASDSDGLVTRVDYFADSNPTPIGFSTSGPTYAATWIGVAAGIYSITARATDNGGATRTSTPVIVTVNPASGGGPSAVFVRADPTTRGTWLDAYGSDGYTLANGASSLPAYAMVTLTGQAAWTWAASTTDVRALQRPAATDRFAATWYSETAFNIDVNLNDGLTHQVAVYAVDWDTTTRAQRVDVVDAISGTVLDSRTLSAFNAGQYLVWDLRGHVTLRVTHTAGSNAALSALLFDSLGPVNAAPSVVLTSPRAEDQATAPATITLEATASDSDGLVTRVDYFADSNPTPIGFSTSGPTYRATWTGVAAGIYSVTARVTDNGGATRTSTPVIVTVNPASGGGPSAVFVRADPTTQGTWLGTYGHNGYTLANGASSLPSFAVVTLMGQAGWTWAASTTDVRALQRPAATDRFAATWYNGASFSIDVNLTDGLTHQVAVYAVDWGSTTRAQRIDVVDAISGTVLDSRTLAAFSAGQYLVWDLRGHVTLRVTHIAGDNAVLSALLFDF